MARKRKLSQSPQARWSRKKKARGQCARCGKDRAKYTQLCDACQVKASAYMRAWRKRKLIPLVALP